MDIPRFIFLIVVVAFGNLLYKSYQHDHPQGIAKIPLSLAVLNFVVFLLASSVLYIFSSPLYISTHSYIVTAFLATSVLWIAAPWLVRTYGEYPKEVIEKHPKWFGLRCEPRTFYLKYFEVLFQQSTFLYILSTVLADGYIPVRLIGFTLIIAIFHLVNLMFISRKEGMIFFWFSIPMGIIFGYLILHGYIFITYTIHLWFYLIFSGRYWFLKQVK